MRIAFDLDETLGVPVTDGRSVVGFQPRHGCFDLLARLAVRHRLILWTVSSRVYTEKILGFGLRKFFAEVYCWDDLPGRCKDVRQVRADYLVDDSDHHREAARAHGLEARYILVPAYGSREDFEDPDLWVRVVEAVIGREGVSRESE